MKINCVTIIFSKDRALQLDATVRSLIYNCSDADSCEAIILYKASDEINERQYKRLAEEYSTYNFIKFVEETDFKNDLLQIISPSDYVLFLVDDNMFVREFSIASALESLKKNPAALGFSFRLGKNTTYCYSQNKIQPLPEVIPIDENIIKFNWTKAQYDFGYPLEVSSSLYKVEDIFPYILKGACNNPNRLEEVLDQSKIFFRNSKPELLCYTFSAAYCNPVNKVQKVIEKNRAGANQNYTSEKLASMFESGRRINITAYRNFFPNACHQETELVFINDGTDSELVSVVIPCFKQAHLLEDAVKSVTAQTYKKWECIIVNDGSPDNTSDVANKLIEKYSGKKIRLVEKTNGGLADARNAGIRAAEGNYVLPLDSDDVLHPNAIEFHLKNLKLASDYSISYSDYQCFGAKTDYISSIEEHEFLNPSRERNGLAYCSMFKKEVWEKNNGYNTNMVWGYEDRDFWIGALEHGFKAKRVPLPLLNYRTNSTSMYSAALLKDKELKAQMILNHPSMYDPKLGQMAAEYLKLSQERDKAQDSAQKTTMTHKNKIISFFAGDADNFHFVQPIMDYLGKEGFTVNSYKSAQLGKEAFLSILDKTDLAWFEWGNGPVIAASRLPKKCPAICRVHRYELYGADIKLLDLSYLDSLILVNQAFEKVLLENVDAAAKSKTDVKIIHNPISETTPFKKRAKNFNIAYVSRFHADKNPALMVQILAQLVKADPRYKIFMAGRMQDKQLYHYCMDLIDKLGLKNNFVYEGVVEDIPAWLQDKSMILSTSIVEAHPVGISEAMMMGLKPIIHNSFGDLDKIFGSKFMFNTADEAVKLMLSDDFNSEEYRNLVISKYGESAVLPQIKELINNILEGKKDKPLSTTVTAQTDKPLVSICIPTYNRAKYIKQAVESALKQNYENLEVVVVDDGSTDGTKERLSEIKNGRLKYYIKEHSGAPATRNLAIEKACGEYILWLDSDDTLSPDTLALYMKALRENPDADVLYGNIIITDENLKPHQLIKYADWQNRNNELLNKFVEENPIPNPGVLIKKSLYEKHGRYDLAYRRAHDYEWFSRICSAAKFNHVDAVSAYWRWHSSNMSSGTVKIDYSFEASLIKKMVDMYGIEKLFSNLASQGKSRNEFLAEAYIKLSARFKALNDETEAKKYLSLYNSVKPSETVKLYAGAKPETGENKKGKILFVAHNFPPYWFAGVENYAYCMAKELQNKGFEVDALYPKIFNDFRSTRLYESSYDGIRTFILQQSVLTSKLDLRSDEIERAFKNLLIEESYDAVHFQHLQGLPFSLVEVAKKLNIPVFYTLHDFDLVCVKTHLYLEETNTTCAGPEGAEKCMECSFGRAHNQAYSELILNKYNDRRNAAAYILNNADAVISPSKYLADKFNQYGFGKNKIAVSPLGLPKLEIKPDIKKDKLTFAFLGSIHPLKNYELAVKAFKKANIDAKFILHGNGLPSNIEKMKRLIAGDIKIEYKGEYTPKDLPDILASVDVVVVPSITENYPTVIREALNAQKIVIASNVGGIPEIIDDNKNGSLFKSNNENELTGIIKRIAKEPKLIEQIKKNIKPVKTIEQDAAEWIKRYNSVIGKQKKKTSAKNSDARKIRIGYISTEPDAFAVPYLRLRSPLNALQDKGLVEIIELGDFANRRSYSLNKNKLQDIDIVIIQRQTAEHLTYETLCGLIDRRKVKVIFDIDDALDRMPENHALLEVFAKIKTNIQEYLKHSDLITVSTNTLRNYYSEFNKNIAVLPNSLNLDIWNNKSAKRGDSKILKVLLSGTATHQHDFEIIAPAIEKILAEQPDGIELYYWGSVSEKLLKYPQVKKFGEFADVYQNYAETLQSANFDFALIPLEENQFNRAKSNIKWLEYSISGIPGVYTDIEAYNESIEDGITGLLTPNTTEGWHSSIRKMIADKKLRGDIKKNAYRKVSEEYSIEKNAALWHKAFENMLNGHHFALDINALKKEHDTAGAGLKSASIIVLTYNSSKTILSCLQSVEKNLRSGDEVIIADNASKDDTIKLVSNFIKGKKQFKFIDNGKNLGFSAGTNAGIKASKNPVTILLNPDTMATNQWLDRLTAHFTDESVAAVGPISNYVAGLQRMDLYLRKIPKGYSIDQIADMNYEANKGRSVETKLLIGFCLAARKDILDKLGYLDEELFLGNDDLELSWRLRLNGYKLKVATDTFIYHEGQHSFNTEAKTTTSKLVQESTNALYAKLQKYYGEENIPSPMELWMVNWFNAENAKYNPKSRLEDVKPEFRSGYVKKEKLTSIIILTYNQLEYTRKCVDSIIKYTPEKYEIIFVDNASTDGTPKYLEGLKTKNANIKLIKNDANLGFPKAVNQGIKAVEGEYILVANNDIHATEGWLSSLINKIELKKEYGIAGPLSNKVSGFQIDKNAKYDTDAQMLKYAANLSRTNKDKYFEFPRVAFLCTLIKREVIDKVGGLDERFTPGNYEDDDYCLRAQKAGYKTVIVQEAFIHHYGSKSFTADGMAKYAERLRINRDIFVDKWGADPDEIWIKGMPIKNRNYAYPLSLNIGDEAYNRAKILFEDGDYNWAKAELKKAFEVCTNGHLEKCYELAAQIDAVAGGESSSSFNELFNEGYRLFSESNFAEAIDKFAQAKRFRNDSSLITNEELSIISGAAYLNMQAYDKAASEFKSAVEQNSSSAKAYEGLGECYFLMDDFGAAKEMFGKTLSLEEENKNALNKMKLINERLKGK